MAAAGPMPGGLLLTFLLLAVVASGAYNGAGEPPVSRRSFPKGFIFGTASSSYQYEGGAAEGGRGPSIWDTFTHQHPEKIADRSNGDVASDSYHLYKEDVRLMKDMGMDAYRFSISWTRILPSRCSPWEQGNCSVGDSGREPYTACHHQLLAHAETVRLYKAKYQALQKGKIGITLVSHWFVPFSRSKSNDDAARRAIDFMFGWFMDPLIRGDYPLSMRGLVGNRLPQFTKEQSKLVKGAFDFIGLNYYTANYADNLPPSNGLNNSYTTDSRANLTGVRNGIPIGPQAASPWLYVYPQGFRDLLLYVKENYGNPTVYITENGVDEFNNKTLPLQEALKDDARIEYYHKHLLSLLSAIRDGANVKGYFAWSLLDNFEWSNGYTVRFGINFVDYNDGRKRYPKNSAHWFKKFLLQELPRARDGAAVVGWPLGLGRLEG